MLDVPDAWLGVSSFFASMPKRNFALPNFASITRSQFLGEADCSR